MKEFKIEVPKGHEIDTENSSLENGVIKFKKVKNRNVVTTLDFHKSKINGRWAFSILKHEGEGGAHKGAKESGHSASLFLAGCNGSWYDEDGKVLNDNYLYYKPNNE